MINKQINQMNETLSRLKQFLKRPFLPTRAHYFGFGSCWLWDLRLSSFISVITFNIQICFWHTWNQTSLYAPYAEYFDTNHYGPFFSLIIAPFAVVPLPVGLILWHVLMALLLYVCIRKLPLNQGKQIFIYWFCAHE